MNFLHTHRKLMTFVGVTILATIGVLCGTVEESILALVPKRIKQQVMLFEYSPLSQKLFVIAQAPQATKANEVLQEVQEKLFEENFIRHSPLPTDNVILHLLNALPTRFSQTVQYATEQKLSEEAIAQQLARDREELFSFQSLLIQQLIPLDPFHLTQILLDTWAALGRDTQTTFENGFLTANEGTIQAGLYDTTASVSDLKAAQQLHRFFTRYQTTLPRDVHVFFMGGLRYTLENTSLIKRDLFAVTIAGLLCLTALFLWFFRTKQALLIYLLPFLVLPPAAWITQLIFGRISGITLGFGSVVVGLSVDYAIYIYFALQQTQTDTPSTLSHIRKHLGCNFLTSALCFAALLFSSIEVFQQIAVFALTALSLALLISLWVFPSYFGKRIATSNVLRWNIKPISFRAACATSAGILLFGIWGITHILFSQDLAALNSTSALFAQEQQITQKLFSSKKNALLFSLGKTREEALNNNEKLSVHLPKPLPTSELFVSKKAQKQNWERWQHFWTAPRTNYARLLLQEEAAKNGFKPDSFAPFWTWLQQFNQPETVDFSAWYNPVIKLSDNSYAVMNVVPNAPVYAHAADGVSSVFISTEQLQKELSHGIKREAVWVVIAALFLNFLAVWGLFRNLKEALFCFIPVILGGCILFGCLALFRIQVNLFGLIFLPLLVGLGIDYAIFQLIKYQARQKELDNLYPAQALLTAGLSTLAGFGVLILAKHAVLFMMGLFALLGIGGAVLVALLILPALRERAA